MTPQPRRWWIAVEPSGRRIIIRNATRPVTDLPVTGPYSSRAAVRFARQYPALSVAECERYAAEDAAQYDSLLAVLRSVVKQLLRRYHPSVTDITIDKVALGVAGSLQAQGKQLAKEERRAK
jgi:hypothetical protein